MLDSSMFLVMAAIFSVVYTYLFSLFSTCLPNIQEPNTFPYRGIVNTYVGIPQLHAYYIPERLYLH